MTYPHRLSTEIRRHKREQFSKWFAYFAVGFALIVFVAIPAGRAVARWVEPVPVSPADAASIAIAGERS